MADENKTKIESAVGLNGTESPVKTPVGVPGLSDASVEARIHRLKGQLDSIEAMLGGDISLAQRRELADEWSVAYRRLCMLQQPA